MKQGVVAEPASAASIAALEYFSLDRNDSVCCTITGSGMKYPGLLSKMIVS